MQPCEQEQSFRRCCLLLLRRSEQLRDGWSWESVPGSQVGYLRKTALRPVDVTRAGAHTLQCADDSVREGAAADDDDDDDGVASAASDSSQVLQYEYHVLYSCSYSSPVLYFRAFTLEGRSLSLEEVWSTVHPNFRARLHNGPLNTITQQEHPLLGQPFFMLHPCRTEEFMQPVLQLAQDQRRPVNRVLTWLSVVGPVVGLDVPLTYFTTLPPDLE